MKIPVLMFMLATLLAAPPSLAEETLKGTVVSLSASALMPVDNNRLIAHYRIEAEGRNVQALREQVNAVSRQVKDMLSKNPSIQQQTTERKLQALHHYDKARGRHLNDGWRLV